VLSQEIGGLGSRERKKTDLLGHSKKGRKRPVGGGEEKGGRGNTNLMRKITKVMLNCFFKGTPQKGGGGKAHGRGKGGGELFVHPRERRRTSRTG